MFCENCGHQISDTAKFCSACGHPVGTTPSPGAVAPPAVPAKRESPRLKASSGNGSITRMSGIRRKPWLLRMPIPDPHTGITVMKAVGTYVTREEAEAVRAEMMKRPATPYQDSTLQDCFRMFKESREYKGRSDKARELYDIAWKYLRPQARRAITICPVGVFFWLRISVTCSSVKISRSGDLRPSTFRTDARLASTTRQPMAVRYSLLIRVRSFSNIL